MSAKIKSVPKPKARLNGNQFEIMIDTGGTFTDGVLIDNRGRIDVAKAETDPADPANGIMNCIALLSEERNLTERELLRNTTSVSIGTTLPIF